MRKRIFHPVFIISVLAPYIFVIFYGRTADFLVFVFTLLYLFCFLIISTIVFWQTETLKQLKKYYGLTALVAICLFVITYGYQIWLSEWIFFKLRQEKLTVMVDQIQRYGKVTEMSDGMRYWKTINGQPVGMDSSEVNNTLESDSKHLLDDVLKQEGVDRAFYDRIRNTLIEVNLIGFIVLPDGTISFTMDGMLDNCFGIAFSETGKQPADNDCGEVVRWVKISDNWYAWGTT
ncbi:hypothetical protein DSL64_27340 [Dyadobacter luteus]|uniref:Uncharacterized protein n=1 Tax=Dyadobacter luteus TaxID=2259619 RepID=A0A3D8Y4C4_9BACT|nr:hypothetical protein [Dyadobacter luteus]REA56141.1 hypothetical protein DSL64_27340 [Dyadobacter luteus]